MPKRFKRVSGEERVQEAFENIPRITNETVAEHREDVLSSARKYKYPLAHSKHRIVVISTGLLVAAVIGFFIYCGLALYKFQSSSGFMYRVTQVLPFPVAKAGKAYVAYENYLFELRRYQHYYQTQQRVDFSGKDGQRQLNSYKPKALQEVVQAAYVKQLARANHVTVTNAQVTAELDALQAQNQSNGQELAAVTQNFFGWSLNDLKRELTQELLAQAVAAKLDTVAQARANSVLAKVKAGGDFGKLAAKYSDDAATKGHGGTYADGVITSASTDVPPTVVQALQGMKVGQTSGVIQAGQTFEIVKLLGTKHGGLQAAHISINIADISTYVNPYAKAHPTHTFIDVK